MVCNDVVAVLRTRSAGDTVPGGAAGTRGALNNKRSASTRTEFDCTAVDADFAEVAASMEDMAPSSSPFFPGVAANAHRRVCRGFALGSRGAIDDVEASSHPVPEGNVADTEDLVESERFIPEFAVVAFVGGEELLVPLRSEDFVFDALGALDKLGVDFGCEVLRTGSGVVERRLRGSEGHFGRSGLAAH